MVGRGKWKNTTKLSFMIQYESWIIEGIGQTRFYVMLSDV